ncbi:MAG: flagellar hook-basal body complex protein [Desulfovibrionaceae bacterium]|nr:flagellar hook-basal body complex protein [Desulfovibrionaceae bacterium]
MNLYTVASGIHAHNEWLGVIGTNISNSGTIGYQSSSFEFADYMYQTTPAGSIGLGTGAWDIRRDTENGALVSSPSSTHIGINGAGYFKVQDSYGHSYYTRSGLFGFNVEGVYTDPLGNAVLGFPIQNGATSSSETTITLPSSTIPPQATTTISTQFNLGFTEQKSPTTLFESWNNGISQAQYAQEITFSVYTPAGTKQTINVYFDLIENAGQENIYEYAVTIPPEDDMRNLPEDSTKKGLLMTGALVFSSGGSLQNMSALTPSTTPENLDSWVQAPLNASGLPLFTLPLASGNQSVALDLGISSTNQNYSKSPSTNPLLSSFLGEPVVQKYASTAYAGDTITEFLKIDGTPEGFLQDINIGQNGVMTARYSNGETVDIYQLNLYTFQATDALQDKGNGLYFYNASIGGAIYSNKPGEGNTGITQGGYLEYSNVDLSTEFVNMILCQTSLTANTKMFTTMDTMLQTAITLKS